MSLMGRISLTINREVAGHYNVAGEWVSGASTPTDISCNIQPFRKGVSQSILPQGISASDVLVIYSRTEMKTANEFNNTRADTATIDGLTYEVMAVENQARNSMSLNHYKAYWVRQDKLTNGGL